jgi:putative solute:sodium symporter small subunit
MAAFPGRETMSEREPAAAETPARRAEPANHHAYWRANLKLTAALMSVWFVVSFGFGILLVEPLNQIPFFGFKLGFWWAQQGAIFVFVILIFVYTAAMKRLDRKYDVHEEPSP